MNPDNSKYDEIWIETNDSQSMCALINGNTGWLMYLSSDGDACFSSRNPSYTGPADAMQEYYLSNGQRDEYPLSWVIPVEEVYRALEYFEKEQRPPTWITWHNDFEDGKIIGSNS